jgi:hypothetical protein
MEKKSEPGERIIKIVVMELIHKTVRNGGTTGPAEGIPIERGEKRYWFFLIQIEAGRGWITL